MDNTKISWADATWNPFVGCTRVSQGCVGCYAEGFAARFSKPGMAYDGVARFVKKQARWTGVVKLVPSRIAAPLKWRKPKLVFVNSMSDLFHERATLAMIDLVFAVMMIADHHTYLILTKRPERQRDYFNDPETPRRVAEAMAKLRQYAPRSKGLGDRIARARGSRWPAPHIWAGTSAEDQATAAERVPLLQATRAHRRFLSAEPLLGPIDLEAIRLNLGDGFFGDALHWNHRSAFEERRYPGLDWVISGGESGARARPWHPRWAQHLATQCDAAGVPFHWKQNGAWLPYSDVILHMRNIPSLSRRINTPKFHKTNVATVTADHVAVSMCRLGASKTGRALDGGVRDAFPVFETLRRAA